MNFIQQRAPTFYVLSPQRLIMAQGVCSVVCYSRMTSFDLIAAPDGTGRATGDLFWDDGDSGDTVANDQYCYVTFTLDNVSGISDDTQAS